jgi:hypothetical protein
VTGPGDPRRRKRRAREPDYVIDPAKPNATIELETADLLQLGQSGLLEQRQKNTRELRRAHLDELPAGEAHGAEPKVFVDLGPDPDAPPAVQTVFVDLGPDAAPPQAGMAAALPVAAPAGPVFAPAARPITRPGTPINVQRVTPVMPRVPTPRPSTQLTFRRTQRGMGIVVFVYLLAAAALAISIYYRFMA